jgi:hypothetical protein
MAGSVEQGGTPGSKMLVARGDERKAICDKYFMRGKRESKVGLRKGGNCSAKITSKSLSRI